MCQCTDLQTASHDESAILLEAISILRNALLVHEDQITGANAVMTQQVDPVIPKVS